MGSPLFPLGRVVATPGAVKLLAAAGITPAVPLSRHASGDWGDVPSEDACENRFSVKHGFRIVSAYEIAGERLWIITEADRSSTCLLLPEEY